MELQPQNGTELASMTKAELEILVCSLGEPKFRAKQIYEWIHKNGASNFDDMSNVPKKIKGKINKRRI